MPFTPSPYSSPKASERASSSPRPIRLHNLRHKPLKNRQRANPLTLNVPRSLSLPSRPLTGLLRRYARPLCENLVNSLLFGALPRVPLIVAARGKDESDEKRRAEDEDQHDLSLGERMRDGAVGAGEEEIHVLLSESHDVSLWYRCLRRDQSGGLFFRNLIGDQQVLLKSRRHV